MGLLLLGGCYTSSGPFPGHPVEGDAALYRHPKTGQTQYCVNHIARGALLGGVIGGVSAGNAYADCKTALDQAGYTREPLTRPWNGAARATAIVDPLPRPRDPWIVGAWAGTISMRGVSDDSTRFAFSERDGRLVWTLKRAVTLNGRPWRIWGSGHVVRLTDGQVELEGQFDGSEPPLLAGAKVTATLQRTPGDELEGHIIGYLQQSLPVRLTRAAR
jgi:hypothetical protein